MRARLHSAMTGQFARFVVVGITQNGLFLGLYAVEVAAGVDYLLSSPIAATVAVLAGFAFNRGWTFAGADRRRTSARRYVAIWAAFAAGSLPVLALLVSVGHVPRILAQAMVICIAAPLSYLAQKRFSFGG